MLPAAAKLAALPTFASRAIPSLPSGGIKAHIGGALCAATFAIYLHSPSVGSVWFLLAFLALWLALLFLPASRPAPIMITCALVIVGSAWVAVGIAIWTGFWPFQTLLLAFLTTVLFPLLFVANPAFILRWLIPVWLIHAGVSLAQWLDGVYRVTGISSNANVGSAFLLLGCVYLLNGHHRARWLMIPLVTALPFTGSRWVAVVASLILVTFFLSGKADWRYIALGIALTTAIVLIVGWRDIYESYNRPSTLMAHLNGLEYQTQLALPPSWTPRGFYDSGIHNVPWRMMHETGILSGLAWMGATLYGLLWKPRFDNRWWLLLTVALLSVMYYHTWVGPLGGFWWLLVRARPLNT